MAEQQESWKLQEKHFGALWKYVKEDEITNIDWDSGQLWIKYADRVRQKVEDAEITEKFIENFSLNVANHESRPFTPLDYLLSAETDTLRITFVHEAFSTSGRSMSIRKSLPKLRFTPVEALTNGYCQKETMHLLVNCVHAGYNFVFCGEPGKGKTEAAKFFSSFIRDYEKVITVEDLREWHYREINPGKDCIEFKVTRPEEYAEALAIALRMNPEWIMVAETRSREVRYLMESWSNGVSSMTTLHVDDARKIPDRILNMLETREDADRIVNQIYADVGVGVLMEEEEIENGKTRHVISQVCFYYREQEKNGYALVVEDGVLHPERMPEFLAERIRRKSRQENNYYNKELERRCRQQAVQ